MIGAGPIGTGPIASLEEEAEGERLVFANARAAIFAARTLTAQLQAAIRGSRTRGTNVEANIRSLGLQRVAQLQAAIFRTRATSGPAWNDGTDWTDNTNWTDQIPLTVHARIALATIVTAQMRTAIALGRISTTTANAIIRLAGLAAASGQAVIQRPFTASTNAISVIEDLGATTRSIAGQGLIVEALSAAMALEATILIAREVGIDAGAVIRVTGSASTNVEALLHAGTTAVAQLEAAISAERSVGLLGHAIAAISEQHGMSIPAEAVITRPFSVSANSQAVLRVSPTRSMSVLAAAHREGLSVSMLSDAAIGELITRGLMLAAHANIELVAARRNFPVGASISRGRIAGQFKSGGQVRGGR